MKTLNPLLIILLILGLLYSCDRNENAPVIAEQEFFLLENSPAGTIVGAVEADDMDEGQVISFNISAGNDNGTFTIEADNGILRVADPAKLDYEETVEILLGVTVADSHKKEPLESSTIITINLLDENEFTPEVVDQNFNLDENPHNGQEIGKILAVDGDDRQDLIYSIINQDEGDFFQIDEFTGMLTVADSSGLDFETNEQYTLQIHVTDNHSDPLAASCTVTVTLNDILEITDGLVANYLFNNNAEDHSGNLNHGIVYGPILTQDRFESENSAYYFDGTNDYIIIEDADNLSFPNQEFSIAMWLMPTSMDHSFILYKGSNTINREYAIGIRPDALLSVQLSNGGQATDQCGAPGNTVPNLSEWYHIVGIWDGSLLSLYVNGQLENQLECNSLLGNFDSGLFFGTYGGSIEQYAYQGAMDDIFIYDRVISEEEITTLYQMGQSQF